MAYRAHALTRFVGEVNGQFPRRDKASDGWKGDAEHAARKSDHNPDPARNGVVRAQDIDYDLNGPGVYSDEMFAIAEHLRGLGANGDHRLAGGEWNGYVIFFGRIAGAGKGWTWRDYTGPNAHKKHLHLSVCSDEYGYDDGATSWGIRELFAAPPHLDQLTEDDMPQIFYPTDDAGQPLVRPAILRIGNEYTELANEAERDQWLNARDASGDSACTGPFPMPPGMAALINHLATFKPRS